VHRSVVMPHRLGSYRDRVKLTVKGGPGRVETGVTNASGALVRHLVHALVVARVGHGIDICQERLVVARLVGHSRSKKWAISWTGC
jgi:hypothetical protein